MSWTSGPDPVPGDPKSVDAIETIVVPRSRDIGGLEVGRVLPAVGRRMVGPFIFWDQMGPGELIAGNGLDVRPHPHINLATITYLFDGQIRHKDSLGYDMTIEPGAVNWMTAGRGIVHSERSDALVRQNDQRVFGIQSWVAMPREFEEVEPSFVHHSTLSLPSMHQDGVYARMIAGSAWGMTSPVHTYSRILYGDVRLQPGASLPIDPTDEERALYLVEGAMTVDGVAYEAGRMLILRERATITVKNVVPLGARFMLLGGDVLDGERHIWWNFVSSRKERIEQAKEEWRQGRFDTIPGDAEEFIPLPEG